MAEIESIPRRAPVPAAAGLRRRRVKSMASTGAARRAAEDPMVWARSRETLLAEKWQRVLD
jgi:hypothetical protein